MKSSALLLTLTFCAMSTVAVAAEPVVINPVVGDPVLSGDYPQLAGPTFLKTADTELEVEKIIAACAERTQELLTQLAAAKTDQEVGTLVREIHRVEKVRELDILSLYIHRAEVADRYDLAEALRDQRERVRLSGRALEVAVSD